MSLLTLWLLLSPVARAEPAVLEVAAASSLIDILPKIGEIWTRETGQPIAFRFDASSRLAKQIVEGVPVDVFFSADQEWMSYLADQQQLVKDSSIPILGNQLVVIVPKSSVVSMSSVSELPSLDRLALAGEVVPAGKYARDALQFFGIWGQIEKKVISSDNVRTTLAWVARDEVDAGIVYRTDALANSAVKIALEIPEQAHQPIVYPAAVVKSSQQPEVAIAFIEFCRSKKAVDLFKKAGFQVLP